MASQKNYQQAVAEYTTQLRGLFAPVAGIAAKKASTRGAEELSPEVLAERADRLVKASQRVGSLTAGYLDSRKLAEREAAEVKLLA